jgi:hypothetical protein
MMAAAASTNWRSLQEMSTAMAASTDPEESPGDVNGRTRPRTVGEMAAASTNGGGERSGSDIDRIGMAASSTRRRCVGPGDTDEG